MTRQSNNTKSSLLQKIEAGFLSFEKSLNGSKSSVRHSIRKEALSKLIDQDFPSVKNEEYKYSPISRKIDNEIEEFKVTGGDVNLETTFSLESMDGHFYFFTNGKYNKQKSHKPEASEYTVALFSEDESSTLSSLESTTLEDDSFVLLNTIFNEEGLVITIPKNNSLSKPIFIIHELNGEETRVSQPRIVVNAESGANAIINEIHYSDGKRHCFTNSCTDFNIEPNAHITHIRTGLESNNAIRVSATCVKQAADSVFTSINTDLGGEFVRNNLSVDQQGTGCVTNMYGLYALSGNMHVDNHTSVNHQYPNTESNELYKGILTGKTTGVFNGKIFVRQAAQKTNAFQQNSNILLSDEAVINTKPQLEIWADDVKCSHGCTIGRLDKEQIFYLRSRGLEESEAKAMLLHAYALEVLDLIPIEELRLFLDDRVLKMLGNE